MRRIHVLFVLVTTSLLGATAGQAHSTTGTAPQAAAATCAHAVPWQHAGRMVGRVAAVTGRVAGTYYAVSSSGSPTFLNIGVDYPSTRRVTAVIWRENRGRFGRPEVRYRGRTVCVRGYVDTYAGAVSIKLSSPSQITVLR